MITVGWTRRSSEIQAPATRLASGRSGHGILPLATPMRCVRTLQPGVVVSLLIVAACGDDKPAIADAAPLTDRVALPAVINRDLDVLLVLGNASGGLEHQLALTKAFPALLAQVSADGMPGLHIGAITTDLGTSTVGGAQGPPIGSGAGGCHDDGDAGALQRSNAEAPFLVAIGDTTNYAGSLLAALPEIAVVGSAGCSFSQPLSAIRAAFANASNVGFRRPRAALAVVVLADEDDCSALDPALFSADTAALGPLSRFRCTQLGTTCAEPDLTTPGPRTSCVPNAGSTVIEDPANALAVLHDQTNDPRRLAFGAIVGASDVAIELRAPAGSSTPIPALAHSCTGSGAPADTVVADPATRLTWLANQFGDRGAIGSICSDDLTPAMTAMGIDARRAMGDPCIEDDVDLSQCEAVDELGGAETPLAACAAPTQTACYELATDAVACPNAAHRKLAVRRAVDPDPRTYTLLRCR